MLKWLLAAIAAFTAIAAYQFGYYQGRLSARSEAQLRTEVRQSPRVTSAGAVDVLPPVTVEVVHPHSDPVTENSTPPQPPAAIAAE